MAKTAMHVLKVEPKVMEELKRMAEESDLPFNAYMRLLVKQHLRTPLRIEIQSTATAATTVVTRKKSA